jgi:hypothetical protein
MLRRLALAKGVETSAIVRVWGPQMLEYLGYALFGVVMIGCLIYIMNALETDEPVRSKRPAEEVKILKDRDQG